MSEAFSKQFCILSSVHRMLLHSIAWVRAGRIVADGQFGRAGHPTILENDGRVHRWKIATRFYMNSWDAITIRHHPAVLLLMVVSKRIDAGGILDIWVAAGVRHTSRSTGLGLW